MAIPYPISLRSESANVLHLTRVQRNRYAARVNLDKVSGAWSGVPGDFTFILHFYKYEADLVFYYDFGTNRGDARFGNPHLGCRQRLSMVHTKERPLEQDVY